MWGLLSSESWLCLRFFLFYSFLWELYLQAPYSHSNYINKDMPRRGYRVILEKKKVEEKKKLFHMWHPVRNDFWNTL